MNRSLYRTRRSGVRLATLALGVVAFSFAPRPQVLAAQDGIERRRITAPIDGIVEEVFRHKGEWVQAGDPVMRLMRMDRLRVQGFLNAREFGPEIIGNRPVRVDVELSGGRRETFRGRIVFVSARIQAGGQYRVWAEVENRQSASQWVLRPGMAATMTIE